MALIMVWTLLILDMIWPVIAGLSISSSDLRSREPDGVNYLIIAPLSLGKSATAWADYRKSRGYRAQVNVVTPEQAKVEVMRNLIQKTYADSGKPYPFYVLLIGHAHPFSSHPDSYLPAASFSVDPSQYPGYGTDPIPSDDVLISEVPGGIAGRVQPIFIGRLPIRTDAEGFLLLERTRKYEETPPVGSGRVRIELVTSDAGFGPQYDPVFEWALETLTRKVLPDEYQWHILDGKPQSPYSYPIDLFPKEVAQRFGSGALALVYIGHGQPELLGWAYSPNGVRGRILGVEDAALIQNANASLGIFTACSAGRYDLSGDDLSVVESIFLTPGGPVATYSSSAWINGTANGRLLIDLFEALLIDNSPTLGKWVDRIESGSDPTLSPVLLAQVLKGIIPMISGIYQGKLLLSPSQADQELDIQHATYNVFGDPALRIAYAQPGMQVSPYLLWQPWKGPLSISGKSTLAAGQQVLMSLEAVPGRSGPQDPPLAGMIDRYHQANSLVRAIGDAFVGPDGKFSGRLDISPTAATGKYLLKAVSVEGDDTYVAAHPVYLGWPPIAEILSSGLFWWLVVGALLWFRIRRTE